jgi:hypothetical protein
MHHTFFEDLGLNFVQIFYDENSPEDKFTKLTPFLLCRRSQRNGFGKFESFVFFEVLSLPQPRFEAFDLKVDELDGLPIKLEHDRGRGLLEPVGRPPALHGTEEARYNFSGAVKMHKSAVTRFLFV